MGTFPNFKPFVPGYFNQSLLGPLISPRFHTPKNLKKQLYKKPNLNQINQNNHHNHLKSGKSNLYLLPIKYLLFFKYSVF
jgi:hypothetical protein